MTATNTTFRFRNVKKNTFRKGELRHILAITSFFKKFPQILSYARISLSRYQIPHRRLTFAEIEGSGTILPRIIQEDTISEADSQSAQGDIASELLPSQVSPITPRGEVTVRTGIADKSCFRNKQFRKLIAFVIS